MSKYEAAVIIPSRGGAPKLHYPLDALEAQTEKNFQVIVVLDGDIDNSAAVVQSYIDRGRLNLSMIVFEENQGRVAALNAGYRAADAAILIRCDDDIEMNEEYISRHIAYHREQPRRAVMGLVHNVFPDTPHAKFYGYYRDKRFRDEAYSSDPAGWWHYWAANCSMPSDLYYSVGGYDPRYRLYGWEDVDMGKMLADAGATFVLARDLEVKHYIAATTTAGKARRALFSGSARNIFLEKHGNDVLKPINPSGLWGFAVKFLAQFTTERSVKYMGNTADLLATRVPPKFAEKIISLVVESSSYAGVKYPHRAQKNF